MARANRPTSTNGHHNGKARFVWPDGKDWRDTRDEMGPVSRNGHAAPGRSLGLGKPGGHPGENGHGHNHGDEAERPRLKPSDVVADTPGQVALMHALRTQRITWAIGSAGVGKTLLAVRDAVEKLQSGRVRRIVLTRPAVEAGESLGYQPGDTDAKISGFMAPMMEALAKFYTQAELRRMKAEGVVQTVAFQFMRGLNFEDTAVIVDEAHNAPAGHIQLALQRLCRGSSYAILADLERNAPDNPAGPTLKQSDLKPELQGGLEYWIGKLAGIPGIVRVDLTSEDCHRDPLVRAMQARGL